MVQSGIALPATHEDLSIPITPWLPTKWSMWLVCSPYASRCLGMPLGHSPKTLDLTVECLPRGLVTGSVGPPEERGLVGERGAAAKESGASIVSGEGLACRLSPAPPRPHHFSGTFQSGCPWVQLVARSNDIVIRISAPPTRRRKVTYIIAHPQNFLSPFLPNKWPREYV